MVGTAFGGGSHYNPDEPRDWHGRWTSGGNGSTSARSRSESDLREREGQPLSDPGAAGRAADLLIHAGFHVRWAHGFSDVTRNMGERFARVLAAWNADRDLDNEAFYHRYVDFGGRHAVDDLRQAAALSAQATTIGDMKEAAKPLAAAVRTIGASHSWSTAMERLVDRANQAIEQGKVELVAQQTTPRMVHGCPDLHPPSTPEQRKRFLETVYDKFAACAKRLGIPVDWLLGLSAHESGYLDTENNCLNNPLGLTDGGGLNKKFNSVDDAIAYFENRFGPYIRGAKTINQFINGLKKAHFNDITDSWRTEVKNCIDSIGSHVRRWKNGEQP